MTKKLTALGVDFGTTNSSVAALDGAGKVRLLKFKTENGPSDTFRSVLYYDPDRRGEIGSLLPYAGPQAIERYLSGEIEGRFVQSIKSFASDRSFTTTNLFGRVLKFEDMVAGFLRELFLALPDLKDHRPEQVVVGRPVRYVSAQNDEDDNFAMERIRSAFQTVGFKNIRFEYEPVGAAYFYEERLTEDQLILIGDFGGGTSDFSLMKVGPSARKNGREILGHSGLGLAGDSFDAQIIRALVSPALGDGSSYISMKKKLPIPSWYFRKLERWHHLSFLKDPKILRDLHEIGRSAIHPHEFAGFIYMVEENKGFELHRAVQSTKCALSNNPKAAFDFTVGDLQILETLTQGKFSELISPIVTQIDDCVKGLLKKCQVSSTKVDRVFLTGGSSFIPAIQKLFAQNFGAEKLASGGEFTSVATGLAYAAQD